MDISERIFFVAAAGRVRRAVGGQKYINVAAPGTSYRLQDGGGDCNTLIYVCVQVAPGSPAPVAARFGKNDPGTASAYHDFTTMGAIFEQVITSEEDFYVSADVATRLLVQAVSF